MMSHAQAIRIETLAGGVACTDREFIKAAHSLLANISRGRSMRDTRHAWLRSGLDVLNEARRLLI